MESKDAQAQSSRYYDQVGDMPAGAMPSVVKVLFGTPKHLLRGYVKWTGPSRTLKTVS